MSSLRQASHFSLASYRPMNQSADRHSARNFPLNDTMNALGDLLPQAGDGIHRRFDAVDDARSRHLSAIG